MSRKLSRGGRRMNKGLLSRLTSKKGSMYEVETGTGGLGGIYRNTDEVLATQMGGDIALITRKTVGPQRS